MSGKAARATAVAAAAFAALVPLAGCGGDDESTIQSVSATTTASTTSEVSTEEFITAADARCAEANSAIANLSTDVTASPTAVQQQLDITKQTLEGLQALGSPEDPDGSLADFYSAMEEQVSVLKQQETALAAGDTAAAETLDTQLDQAKSDAATAATAFGLEECGQEGSTISSDSTTSVPPDSAAPPPTTTTPVTPVTPPPAPPVTPPATGGTGTGGGTPPATGGGGSSGGVSPGG